MLDTLARALSFAGALLTIGAVPARALLRHAWQEGVDVEVRDRAIGRLERQAFGAALLLVLGAAFALHAQAAALLEEGEALSLAQYRMALASGWAWGWKAQTAAALLSVAAWVPWRGRPFVGPRLAPFAALALAATFPLTGHPRVVPAGPLLGVLTVALHLLGASLWLGMLGHLVTVAWSGPETGRTRRVAVVIAAFSPLALAGAGLTAFTGLVTAWQTVGGFAALTTTDYGRVLLLKLLLLAAVAALGGYNWKVVRPRLAVGSGDLLLRRSALTELVLGLLLLLVTAVLVTLPAPGLD